MVFLNHIKITSLIITRFICIDTYIICLHILWNTIYNCLFKFSLCAYKFIKIILFYKILKICSGNIMKRIIFVTSNDLHNGISAYRALTDYK